MKINYFKFSVSNWREALIVATLFEPWLYKLACAAKPIPDKSGYEFPGEPEMLIGLVGLEIGDLKCHLPVPLWNKIEQTITGPEESK